MTDNLSSRNWVVKRDMRAELDRLIKPHIPLIHQIMRDLEEIASELDERADVMDKCNLHRFHPRYPNEHFARAEVLRAARAVQNLLPREVITEYEER